MPAAHLAIALWKSCSARMVLDVFLVPMQGGPRGRNYSEPGALRLLMYPSFGSQGSWLMPIALTALVCSLVLLRHADRSDPRRALVLLAGGWFLTYAATFSFMNGVIHPYYLVTIAPPIAILVAIGWQLVWPARRWLQFRLAMAASVLAAAVFAFGYLINGAGAGPALGILVVLSSLIGCELMVFRIRKTQNQPVHSSYSSDRLFRRTGSIHGFCSPGPAYGCFAIGHIARQPNGFGFPRSKSLARDKQRGAPRFCPRPRGRPCGRLRAENACFPIQLGGRGPRSAQRRQLPIGRRRCQYFR